MNGFQIPNFEIELGWGCNGCESHASEMSDLLSSASGDECCTIGQRFKSGSPNSQAVAIVCELVKNLTLLLNSKAFRTDLIRLEGK